MQVGFLFFGFWTVALGSSLLVGQPVVTALGPYGGDVRSLAVDPDRADIFFLGTADGQIFVSQDAGDTWTKLVPGLNRRNIVVDNLAFDPLDSDTLYAATWELKSDKGWLFRSRDGGQTWKELSLGRYHSAIRAIAIAPSNPQVIALGISQGVILSLDGGQTWDRITRGYRSLYNVESLAFDPQDVSTLYVGTWRLGWKTTDQGKSWKAIHKGMFFDSDLFSLLVDPRNPEVLYSSACTGVYKSENSGQNWVKLKNGLPKEARRTRTLHLDPSNPSTIYAGTTVGLFVSHNAGISWRQLLSNIVVNAVAVHPKNNRIILLGSDDAGVLKSEDGGATFSPANRGFIHRQIPAVGSDPRRKSTYYVSVSSDGDYGGFFLSPDKGQHWHSYNQGLDDAAVDIRTILPAHVMRRVYIGTRKGVFVGVPLEEPWKIIEKTRKLTVFDLAFTDAGENRLFLATADGVFRLDLTNGSLEKLIIPVYKGKVNTVFYDQASGQVFAGTDIGVFRSNDDGQTWNIKVKGLPYSPINVLEKNGQRLFCGTRFGLFFSDDDGETWWICKGVYPIDIIAIQTNPSAENEIFAADFLIGHLFYSDDGGDEWEVVDLGFSGPRISALAFGSSGDLLAGTISEGVYVIARPARSITKGQ
ncbi:hypothetical protein MYX84_12595 [Acidobacteria bacterium AH-259-O06]|nr:hypothetical protein [Acidobacteria bacterium AH-259-O06]